MSRLICTLLTTCNLSTLREIIAKFKGFLALSVKLALEIVIALKTYTHLALYVYCCCKTKTEQ